MFITHLKFTIIVMLSPLFWTYRLCTNVIPDLPLKSHGSCEWAGGSLGSKGPKWSLGYLWGVIERGAVSPWWSKTLGNVWLLSNCWVRTRKCLVFVKMAECLHIFKCIYCASVSILMYQDVRRIFFHCNFQNLCRGASGWLSRLSVWLPLRSWSHGS